jgi:hypothetical protein
MQIAQHVDLETLAREYEWRENASLDKIVAKYNLTKDCDCITHDGPCWVHMQRFDICQNANIIRRGGQLVVHAFSVNESMRLGRLASELKTIERSRIAGAGARGDLGR